MGEAQLIDLLPSAGKAFFICLVLTPIVRDIFRSYDVVDQPGLRKVHAHPIPRVGGIAIALAYAFTMLPLANTESPLSNYHALVWRLLPGASLMFMTGLVDDFFDLPPKYKLLGQIGASCLVIWAGVRIETIADNPIPVWLSWPLTLFWLLLCTNALNLIDGLDGLCAGMGLMAALTLLTAGWLSGNEPLVYAMAPLAGALIGFLCFNFNPATVFLGDSGALIVGFLLGCYGVIWVQKSATLLSVILPLLAILIPLLDVSLSVLRRFLRNRPIFSADRGHIHHRLLDQGLTPARAVLVLYLVSAVAAAAALLLSNPDGGPYQVLVILAFCIAVWLGIRQLRYAEFIYAGKLLFGGHFQQVLSGHLELEKLRTDLQKAKSDDACWGMLVDTARSLGFTRIRWSNDGETRTEVVTAADGITWTMRIPLGTNELIELERPMDANGSVDLAAFADNVHRALISKRQPAGAIES